MLLTVVVADAARMTAIRDGMPTPGRVLRYTTSNLASVFESIRANQPGLIIFDGVFLQTPAGHVFVERIRQLSLAKLVLQTAVFERGHWTMASLDAQPAPVVQPESPRIVAVSAGLDTRRVPRFLVQNIVDALAEGSTIQVIDLSVLGAQIISHPLMRPKQKIKLGLPDTDNAMHVVASVAWSVFEKSAKSPEPYFRVGMEFNDAVREALEDYCRRHCSPDPLPIRR
jgi:PilZ domain